MNNYQLGEMIESGGMGAVYKGRHVGLERDVAIKFILPHVASDEAAVERFLREARLAAKINHPNVVHVYDTGVDGQGRPYIVMELLQGEPLKQRLMRGPMTESDAVEIAKQVLLALEKAHAMGVIHRDIKPGNIFLCADRVVKILDFGVAKGLDAGNVTLAGKTVGSPAYMSPEQAEGNPVDHRTDLYSVGIVLYELLAGAVPFRGENSFAIMQKHLSSPPPSLPSGVHGALKAVVERALAKKPDKRFANAQEMRQALEKVPGRNVVVAVTGPGESPPAGAMATPSPGGRSTQSAEAAAHKKRAVWPFVAAAVVLAAVAIGVAPMILGGLASANSSGSTGGDPKQNGNGSTGTTSGETSGATGSTSGNGGGTSTSGGTGSNGGTVRTTTTETAREPIKFQTHEIPDPSLAAGTRKVETPGKDGVLEVTYTITLENGVEVGREKAGERTISNPTDEVVRVGSGSAPSAIEYRSETRTEPIRYRTQTRTNNSLRPGATRVVQEGSNGQREVVYRVGYKDGREVSRTQVSSSVSLQPVPKIVEKGPERQTSPAWHCTECGTRNAGSRNFCTECGTRRPGGN